jgi:hypothetical protein
VAHYAKVSNGIVVKTIVAEADFIESYQDNLAGKWVQTSYNTHGGVHSEGGTPLRKNYAGIGMIYDATRDAFYAPQPYASWVLNDTSCIWEAPTAMPVDDKTYRWDEDTTARVEETP